MWPCINLGGICPAQGFFYFSSRLRSSVMFWPNVTKNTDELKKQVCYISEEKSNLFLHCSPYGNEDRTLNLYKIQSLDQRHQEALRLVIQRSPTEIISI